ncbi:transcription elongation factor SPT4-like isoform X2 [Coccinella septempunctata]|uniref:transcription elongation factor SPT4-like isoform X2 n=1 Tax=Coccinella septempunctata TaxID=41139 RepID=UPI001D0881EF|nr:transcription elongation factor SPT4-like isoform X2 [Coccinella septempunctata]
MCIFTHSCFIVCRVLSILKMSRKNVRACLGCLMIKSVRHFMKEGCENCDSFLKLRSNPDRVQQYTTMKFGGVVDVDTPSRNWFHPIMRTGTYATCVEDPLPYEIFEQMKMLGLIDSEKNCKYFIKKEFRYRLKLKPY